MIMNFIRENKIAAAIVMLLRFYIGYQWLTAGFSKITSGSFDASGFMKMASENSEVPGWWASFLNTVALPNQEFFTFIVMWGELLVGLALILGIFTNFAALMGITMNLAFLFSGAGVVNVEMAILTVFIVIAGNNAGRIGLDRWVIAMVANKFFTKQEKDKVALT